VRGVTAQQHPSLHEPFGDGSVQLPEPERQHLGFEPVDSDGGTDPRPRALVGEDVEGPLRGLYGDLAQPAARPVERLEHAARVLVGDEEEHALAVAEVRLDVGPEVAVHDVRQLFRALQVDPELAADQARRPICRQQGSTGERLGRSRGPRMDLERGTLVGRAPAPHELRRFRDEPDVDHPGRPDALEQDRFDELLRRHDRPRRADVRPGSLEALRLDDAELLAGGRPQEADGTLPPGRGVDAAQPLVHGGSPPSRDLHRPRVEVPRLRVPGRGVVLLDQH
jgi:hypothetical protein